MRPHALRTLLQPGLPDVFFAVLLVSAFAHRDGLRAMLVDGDTGWHIRTGELILATGHVPLADHFSFTRAGAPWFAWEWLSDVLFARLHQWGGLATVAAAAGAVLALASTVLLVRMLRRGCGLWIALGATLAAASASSVHYLARPHVFSILFYTIALGLVEEDRRQRTRALWLLVPMTALWANLHAGFVAWLGTVAILAAVAASRRYAVLGTLCAAATLINPYGWRLHAHVAQYLGSSWIVNHVQEFQSPNIRSEGMIVFALFLLAGVALAPRADRFEAVLVLVWGFAALRSARHVPFFAIAAAPVVATVCAEAWRSAKGGAARVFRELGRDLGRGARLSLWTPLAAAAVIFAVPAASFPESRFPVAAVARNLARLAPPAAPPRILTSDQWADYLIFRLYPRQRVFFDGRSDFFGPALGGDYRALMAAERPWRELMDRYGFELALLPYDWPLSTVLDREPGWHRVYQDSVSVLFAREGGATP